MLDRDLCRDRRPVLGVALDLGLDAAAFALAVVGLERAGVSHELQNLSG